MFASTQFPLKSISGRIASTLSFAFILIGVSSQLPSYSQERTKQTPVASQAEADKTYSLRRVYKKGEVTRHKTQMTMMMHNPQGGDEINIVMNFVTKELVNSAEEDGSNSVTTEYEKAAVSVLGTEQDLLSSLPKITVSHDKDGKATTKVEGGSPQTSQMFAGMGDMVKMGETVFPKKPVKVGESWEVETKVPGQNGADASTFKSSMKLVSIETLDEVKVFRLESKTDSDGATPVHQTATILIEVETGKLVKMYLKGEVEAAGQPMKMEMNMNMVKPLK